MMRALIIEDETAAALNLRGVLAEVAADVEVVGVLESIAESVEWFTDTTKTEIDVVFMDIHLADGDSFAIFEMTEVAAPIIFTTAYDQYALEAFRVNSIDYLLKPINATDMCRALTKLARLSGTEREQRAARIAQVVEQSRPHAILVHRRDRIIPLRCEQIAYCYATSERTQICMTDGQSYSTDKSLEALSKMLSEADFFRASRQFIIARRAIRDIAVWFGSRLAVNLDTETPERVIISKARAREFKKWVIES